MRMQTPTVPSGFTPGFTLIELATVITIIGLLAAIAVPNFLNATVRAKLAKSKTEQALILWSLESYFVDTDSYPLNQEEGSASPGDLTPLTTPIPYLSSLPPDSFLFPQQFPKQSWITENRNNIETFFYVNFIQVNEGRMALAPYGNEGSANYVVYGLGPQFNTGQDPMDPQTFIPYTGSNGVVSSGVIRTFGP